MVSKKILGVAIAAAFASQGAFAAIDLQANTGAIAYAKETLITGTAGNDGVVTAGYFPVTAAAGLLDIQTRLGSGVSSGNQIFLKFKLTNAKFKTAVAGADLTFVAGDGPAVANAPAVNVQSGGQAGDASVIFQVTAATGGLDQLNKAQLALLGLQLSSTADATVTYEAYDSASAAVNETVANRLATGSYDPSSGQATAFALVNALSLQTAAPADQVADVIATAPAVPFGSFVTNGITTGQTANLGTVKFLLNTATARIATSATSALVTVASDVIALTSKAKVTGDFFGTWALGTAGACNASEAFQDDAAITGTKLDTLDFADADAANKVLTGVEYNVCVTNPGNTTAIAASSGAYGISFAPAGITNAVFPPSAASVALGKITRNGTSLYVANFSTVADYNQRLVLVNRSNAAMPYTISFTTESGVTAVGKTTATTTTGTLPANQVTSLKAADIFDSLTGPVSRAALSVSITGAPASVDAATTLVNTTTKSTDTVKIDKN